MKHLHPPPGGVFIHGAPGGTVDLPGLDPRLVRRADAAAAWLDERKGTGDTVTVVHHIDADGVTSGAIAQRALERAGIRHRMVAAKSLDDVHVARVQDGAPDALWFCDFGSTAYMHFDVPRLVCDHHQLVRDGREEDFAHLNPLLDGISGQTISGAGCAFLAALAHDPCNMDLLPVALVGAAGDLQDRKPPEAAGIKEASPGADADDEPGRGAPSGHASSAHAGEEGAGAPAADPGAATGMAGFHGANAVLLEAGRRAGLVETATDLAWFGPETRPLRKFLAYGNDPAVPGITGDPRGAEALLSHLDVSLMDEDRERTWADLDDDERRRVRDAVVLRLLDCGLEDRVTRLWRSVVRITAEAPGSPTRELQEFGTLLNSTARYGEPETGLEVAAGDRGPAYADALDLLLDHRKHLVKSLDAFRHVGVQELAGVQWVHLGDRVRDTIVGIVCGMALDGLGLRRDMPLVGLAHTDDGRTKASGRAPGEIQGRIDLAVAMREAAAAVGGQGGGHRGAAGATVPRSAEHEFLRHLDAIVATQLGRQPTKAAGPATAAQYASIPARHVDRRRAGPEHEAPRMEKPWAAAKGQSRLF